MKRLSGPSLKNTCSTNWKHHQRDDGDTIYNLFGNINWRNLYTLNMYNLKELEILVKQKGKDKKYHQGRHLEIIQSLQKAADNNNLIIPPHWLP